MSKSKIRIITFKIRNMLVQNQEYDVSKNQEHAIIKSRTYMSQIRNICVPNQEYAPITNQEV